MKSYIIGLIATVMLCGCGERVLTPSELALQNVHDLIAPLKTNSSESAISRTQAVRSNLFAIANVELKRKVLEEWKNALFDIEVGHLKPSSRYGSIRAASEMVLWDMMGAIWDAGGTYEDVWNVYFEMLAWLDGQCRAMRPKDPEFGCDPYEEERKWTFYGALLAYKECVIENLERDAFEDRAHRIGQSRINAVKAKFEKTIGRPVRPASEIKMLGRYVDEVWKRIEKERKEAMQKAEALQREMWKKNPPPLRPPDGRYIM